MFHKLFAKMARCETESSYSPSTRSNHVRIDFEHAIKLFLLVLLYALLTLVKTKVVCHINRWKNRCRCTLSVVLAFWQRCTSSQPFIKETDVSAKCATRSSSHLPLRRPNLDRYIYRFNSLLNCCVSFSCAAVCSIQSQSGSRCSSCCISSVSERKKKSEQRLISFDMYEKQVCIPEGTVYKLEFQQDPISELPLWRCAQACTGCATWNTCSVFVGCLRKQDIDECQQQIWKNI